MTRPQVAPEGVGPCVGSRRAGELLGVDERTIVRWADDGTIPVAYVTRGGHRRFQVADVEAIADAQRSEADPVST